MRIDKIIYTFIYLIFSCSDEKEVNTRQITMESEIVEVYLLSQLNDSRGFCLDVIGYKNSADVKKGIQAHTCYSSQGEISVDQGFDEAVSGKGSLKKVHFFNLGKDNKWEQYLNKDEIDYLVNKFSLEMKELGYI